MTLSAEALELLEKTETVYTLNDAGQIYALNVHNDADQVLERLHQWGALRELEIISGDLSLADIKLLANSPRLCNLSLTNCDPERLPPRAFAYLAAFPELMHLHTNYSGNIDEAMRHLRPAKKLKTLSIQNCSLSDRGMDDVTQITSLESLTLWDLPRLTPQGMRLVSRLGNLKELNLQRMAIDDEGLREVGKLEQLQWLTLVETKITQDGIEALTSLKRLESFWLYQSQTTEFSPKVLQWLSGLPNLDALTLENVPLTDDDLRYFYHHPKLVSVSLSKSRVTVAGAERLENTLEAMLQALMNVSLGGEEIRTLSEETLQLLKAAGATYTEDNIGRVVELNLGRQADKILERLHPLTALCELSVFEGDISLAGIKLLASSPRLHSVSLNNCDPERLTPEAFAHLASLPKLRYLSTDYLGDVDEAVALLRQSKLSSLTLSETLLTDRGLDNITQIASLEELYLTELPQLTSAGLRSISRLKNLKKLGLYHVALDDEGLREIDKLEQLESLVLIGTKVTKEGLEALTGLKRLVSFQVNRTELSPKTLQWLASLPNLRILIFKDVPLADGDLRHFHHHPKLWALTLENSRVTRIGAERLLETLQPDARVRLE